MPSNVLSEFLHHLRGLALPRDGAALTDAQLLEAFVRRQDRQALEGLVRRHAPMVWAVCRRALAKHHDAEDAFQAAFLVLVRKAASIRSGDLLANWLYRVAYQTAIKARQAAAKRGAREKPMAGMPEPKAESCDAGFGPEVQALLDEELSRLPDKYRIAVVVCDLEGRSRAEAAQQLGAPEGTVASRLARGRALLARRLRRRGVGVPAVALAATLPQQAASGGVPAALLAQTAKNTALVAAGAGTAAGAISAQVTTLTEAVIRATALAKLKAASLVLLLAALTACGGMVAHHMLATRPIEIADVPPSNAAAAKSVQGFDEPTATAWKKAGAQVGWMGKNKYGFLIFDTRPDELTAAAPAFQFASCHEKLLAGLPSPAVPFGLSFCPTPVTDAGLRLKELAPFKNLQSLLLRCVNVTDAGLKELAPLQDLQALSLEGTPVTDAGLKELAALKSLQTLNLTATGPAATDVTDAGLKELANFKSLQALDLGGTKVTDAGMKELAGLQRLHTLGLWRTKVTDAGLKEFAGLKNLQRLDLTETHITDAGLRELAGLQNLRLLALGYTQVTDVGLKELAGLKQLAIPLPWRHAGDGRGSQRADRPQQLAITGPGSIRRDGRGTDRAAQGAARL